MSRAPPSGIIIPCSRAGGDRGSAAVGGIGAVLNAVAWYVEGTGLSNVRAEGQRSRTGLPLFFTCRCYVGAQRAETNSRINFRTIRLTCPLFLTSCFCFLSCLHSLYSHTLSCEVSQLFQSALLVHSFCSLTVLSVSTVVSIRLRTFQLQLCSTLTDNRATAVLAQGSSLRGIKAHHFCACSNRILYVLLEILASRKSKHKNDPERPNLHLTSVFLKYFVAGILSVAPEPCTFVCSCGPTLKGTSSPQRKLTKHSSTAS